MDFLETAFMKIVPSFVLSVSGRLFALAVPLSPVSAHAEALTNVFYLGDSYLDDGNYKALTHLATDTYAPPWSTVSNLALGLPTVGRWTPSAVALRSARTTPCAGAGIVYFLRPPPALLCTVKSRNY